MNEPIKAGDLAVVISGQLGEKSPNIGLIVKVVRYMGDEKTYGRIWRCETDYAERLILHKATVPTGHTDFAQSWLRKIEPDAPPPLAKTTDKELTV
jgi:hypothetical protein